MTSAPAKSPNGSPSDRDDDEDLSDDDENLGDDDDEDLDDDDGRDDDDPLTNFLLKFKTAMHAIYEEEAESEDAPPNSADLLDKRLRTIAAFNPMGAVVPAMEEAQEIARRLEAANSPSRARKQGPSMPSGKKGGIPTGPVSSAGAAVIAKGAQISDSRRKSRKSSVVAGSTTSKAGEATDSSESEEIEVENRDVVDLTQVTRDEFSQKIHEIGGTLASIEPTDQTVWSIYLEPNTDIKNLRLFSRALSKEGTGPFSAYNSIKKLAMLLPVKEMLTLSDRGVLKNRNFPIEVTSFINAVKNTVREFTPDNRQLNPLPRILDHAAATMLRLEAIRTNQMFSEQYPDAHEKQAVMNYYEEALRSVTDPTDREVLSVARDRADNDTIALLEIFEAKKLVDRLLQASREFVEKLISDGNAKTDAQAQVALEGTPLVFQEVEAPDPPPGPVPPELLAPGDMGELFDLIAQHVVERVWAALSEIHDPPDVVTKLKEMLKELLVSTFVLQGEKKRHQENPRVALNVVTLDKISGDNNFINLCVRVGEDGKVKYVEGFEDGTYVDLFELREYKPSRMRAKEKTDADEEELQTGHKYLYSVGRTNRLFGESPVP